MLIRVLSFLVESLFFVLIGAALMRAFTYFYLINVFGDVPLVTTTDYRTNSTMPRTPVADVYTQIMIDLQGAQQLLPGNYAQWSNERIRPVRHAATALLARVALYRQNWQQAESYADQVIGESTLYQVQSDLNTVFLKNNSEASILINLNKGSASAKVLTCDLTEEYIRVNADYRT